MHVEASFSCKGLKVAVRAGEGKLLQITAPAGARPSSVPPRLYTAIKSAMQCSRLVRDGDWKYEPITWRRPELSLHNVHQVPFPCFDKSSQLLLPRQLRGQVLSATVFERKLNREYIKSDLSFDI